MDYKEYGTTIVLPFNHREKNPKDIYYSIEQSLDKMDSNAFMFLNNIESVTWLSREKNGSLIKEIVAHDEYINMAVMTSDEDILNEYMIFSAPMADMPNLNVSIAFKIHEFQWETNM
jgi:hypothetical protein